MLENAPVLFQTQPLTHTHATTKHQIGLQENKAERSIRLIVGHFGDESINYKLNTENS